MSYTHELSRESICYSARITVLLGQWWQWVMPSTDVMESLMQAQSRAGHLNDSLAQADVLKLRGDLTRIKTTLASAQDIYAQALSIYEEYLGGTDDPIEQASTQSKIGDIHWHCQDLSQSFSAYENSLTLYAGQQMVLQCARVSICLGQVNESLESPSSALECYQDAHDWYVSEQDQSGITRTNRLINRLRGRPTAFSSLEYFVESLTADVSLELVPIPEGSFTMGSPTTEENSFDDEGPQHEVHVPAFYMGIYPVTQAQWSAVMGTNLSCFQGENRPVEYVSWHDAIEFCDRLSEQTGNEYRLPSESEWEYACRSGTTTAYYFGESITTEQAHFGKNSNIGTSEVGKCPSNIFGLYDMHGNVWEWCQDHWHKTYDGAPTDGTAWLKGGDVSYRMLRGGSWYDSPRDCRSASRNRGNPDFTNLEIGFRIVLAPR